MLKVYLAGPLAGLTFDEAQGWRLQVATALAPDIEAYSPLRGKQVIRKEGVIGTAAYPQTMTTDRAILTRDHKDCITSDLVFVNLLRTRKASIGTCMEIAWAFDRQIPLVVAAPSDGHAHDHPMVRAAINFVVGSLDEAIAVTRSILLP